MRIPRWRPRGNYQNGTPVGTTKTASAIRKPQGEKKEERKKKKGKRRPNRGGVHA